MGNAQSSNPENNGAAAAFDPDQNGVTEVLNNPTNVISIIAIVLAVIAIVVVFNDYIFHRIPPTITQAASVNPSGMLQKVQSAFKFGPSNFLGNLDWKIITPILLFNSL